MAGKNFDRSILSTHNIKTKLNQLVDTNCMYMTFYASTYIRIHARFATKLA